MKSKFFTSKTFDTFEFLYGGWVGNQWEETWGYK